MLIIKKESKKPILFSEVKDHQLFMSNGVIYTKLLEQDLKEWGINNVNAVGVLSGGLTRFWPDEKVYICYAENLKKPIDKQLKLC